MEKEFAQLLETCTQLEGNVRDDSRKVRKGDIFVAVPGEKEDGSGFIRDAVAAGAAYVVCKPESIPSSPASDCVFIGHEEPREAVWQLARRRWGDGRLPPRLIGITGTNGKTTCAFLLEHFFQAIGSATGVLGTISYRWPGHCEAAPLTTPGPLQVREMLVEMGDCGVETAIMEVSSHALAQQRVGGLDFTGAIFTNLTQDHLDFHENMENYFAAKAKLFLDLPLKDKACAINADDAYGHRLLERLPQAISFGWRQEVEGRRHLAGKILSAGVDGCHLLIKFGDRQWEIRSPLVGAFNADNLLAAQALLLGLGFAPGLFDHLATFQGVPGRLERIANPAGLNVFVDYAHTPDALENVLRALRGAGFRRLITVFGCGGNRDRAKRPMMGEAVAKLSDVAILTSDNPRDEDPMAIIADARAGLARGAKVKIEPDRRKATALGLEMLEKGDALLIAGKGHEDYQIIRGVRHHYSDQEVVREILHCA